MEEEGGRGESPRKRLWIQRTLPDEAVIENRVVVFFFLNGRHGHSESTERQDTPLGGVLS